MTTKSAFRDGPAAHSSPSGLRWDRPGIPHLGWTCIGVDDLGELVRATCEMCGKEEIRYVHTCQHPDYLGSLEVGCVCVERMTGDYTGPKKRESKLRNRSAKRKGWLSRLWKKSRNGGGSEYTNLRGGPNVGVFPSRFGSGWFYRVGGEFSRESYPTSADAKLALFDDLYPSSIIVPTPR